MKELTVGQKKVLQELTDYYDYARSSAVRRMWALNYYQNLKYYYGDQWSDELKKEFEDVKAFPLVVNKVEPTVNMYSSLLLNSSKRIAAKATTTLSNHGKRAEDVNNFFYSVQTKNRFQSKSNQMRTDALIGGIGYLHFGYDEKTGEFFIDWINPDHVYPDPDDQTQHYENPSFWTLSYFVSHINCKQRYPEHADFFDALIGQESVTNAINDISFFTNSIDDTLVWTKGRSIRLVEVYYKKNVKYYEGTIVFPAEGEDELDQEQYFCTFDEEFAKSKMAKGTKLEEKEGTQIWKGVYCDNMLLESGALYPQVPNQKHFPIIPLCLKRNYMGMPYGVVDGLIPLSIAKNYIWTKTIHGLGSKFLLMEGNQDDMAKTAQIYLEQMSQKMGVISLKNAKDAQLINSENLLQYLFQANQRIDVEFEQTTQLHNEIEGEETNAVSGVAIRERATNSAKAQSPLHSTYNDMLLSMGELMLDTLKGINDLKYPFKYSKDGKEIAAILDDEISTINFEIYTDIAPPFSSSYDEEVAKFEGLMNSPNPALLMSHPLFLKKSGFDESDAVAVHEAYTEVTEHQAQQQQELLQQQQAQELVQQQMKQTG